MNYIYTMPNYIEDKEEVYEFITKLYDKFANTLDSKIILDFSLTSYINPNLMAPLGLVLTKIKYNNNEIFLSKMRPSIQKILLKYGFVKKDNFTFSSIMQNYIKYKSFCGDNTDGFEKYLNLQLNDISNKELISTLVSYLMEIFVNVKTHARVNENKNQFKDTEIFTSGYYNENKNYIRFSISNNGKTFMSAINDSLNYIFNYDFEYIEWALKKKNTSKKNVPGGLGLYMLNELVKLSNGELIILSGKGYYHLSYSNKINDFTINVKDFSTSFPGTTVTVKLPLDLIPSGERINNSMSFNALSILEGVI